MFFFLDREHSHISKKNWLVYMFTKQAWPLSRHKVTCRRENSLAHQWCSRDTSLGQLWQNRVFELICFPPWQWIRVKWHGFFNFVTGQLWLNYLKHWLPRNNFSYENISKKIIQGRFPFLIKLASAAVDHLWGEQLFLYGNEHMHPPEFWTRQTGQLWLFLHRGLVCLSLHLWA